jgi:hypothetical protein
VENLENKCFSLREKALAKFALAQMRKLKASDMYQIFSQQILPLLQTSVVGVVFETKKVIIDGKEYYAVLFRDKDADKNR